MWVSNKLLKNRMLCEFDDRNPNRSGLHLISMHEWNIAILISTNTKVT